MSCDLKDWLSVSKYTIVCKVHNVTFPISERCPFRATHPLFADGDLDSELGLADDNSRVITSKSRGVLITRPLVSKRNYVKKNKSIYERFHNYGVKFNAVIDWDSIPSKPMKLNNNVFWKRLDFDSAIVKVFKKSILVTLRKDREIIHNDVREAEKRSISLINEILSQLPDSIKVAASEVVNVHNAFVNHPFAKRNISVKVNDELRIISDNSKGSPEFEPIHPKYAISDSEYIENDTIDLIDKGLSRNFLAQSINSLIEDRKYYADNLKSHVSAINTLGSSVDELKEVVKNISSQQLLNNLSSHIGFNSNEVVGGVRDSSIIPSAIPSRKSEDRGLINNETINSKNSPLFPDPITLSKEDVENKSKAYRLFRARKLLNENGWGYSIW